MRVREVVSVLGGGTPRRSVPEYYGGDIPWVTPKDMKQRIIIGAQISLTEEGVNNSPAKVVPPGSVLVVVRSGVLKHTLPVALTTKPVTLNQDMKALVPAAEVDARYLVHMVKALESTVLSWVRATTADNWPIDSLLDHEISLPGLREQRRIAAILDQADSLRAMRCITVRRLELLAQELYESQFATAPRNAVLSDAIASLTGGKNLVGGDDSCNSRRVLKISAVTSGTYRETESKPLPDGYEPPSDHLVRPGDVLISRANTSALVGASALVGSTSGNMVLPDKLWRATPHVHVSPTFLVATLQARRVRSEISARATGTGGSMKNISKPRLLSTPIHLPQLAIQQRFAEQVLATQRAREVAIAHLESFDVLFGSLQHRAFRGEL
ncbi:restriction endonuclease subunit S [Agromyces sp. ISL-38]|uniref:restriction endonuclease subunit S n=1 Tax=Agromyces sp. ISL-38 TaxID=2819107 RepID=UPI0027DF2BF3|nr:restriction endonuclease subunit S [Agromyces sp. ISL-38]